MARGGFPILGRGTWFEVGIRVLRPKYGQINNSDKKQIEEPVGSDGIVPIL